MNIIVVADTVVYVVVTRSGVAWTIPRRRPSTDRLAGILYSKARINP